MLFGCAGGYWLYAQDGLAPQEWHTLGQAPAPITRLLDADFATIYVQTSDQRIFSCSYTSQYDRNCWSEIQQVPRLVRYPCQQMMSTLAPPPPQPALETLTINYCHRFGRSEFVYIRLANGTVMQWSYDDFHWGLPPQQAKHFRERVFGGSIIGLGIGLTGSALMLWLHRRKRQQKPA
jgi:hypothetical protein